MQTLLLKSMAGFQFHADVRLFFSSLIQNGSSRALTAPFCEYQKVAHCVLKIICGFEIKSQMGAAYDYIKFQSMSMSLACHYCKGLARVFKGSLHREPKLERILIILEFIQKLH